MEVIRIFFRVLFLAFLKVTTSSPPIFKLSFMPRYYRRRYTRVVRPKKKWATNLVNVQPGQNQPVLRDNYAMVFTKICENSQQSGNPTPVVLKAGNFKLQLDASFAPTTAAAVSFSTYILYVPEGMWPGSGLTQIADVEQIIHNHPEWILAWRYSSNDFMSNTGPGNVDSVKVSSRLKRNLNSGDAIYFIGIAVTSALNTFASADIRGMCQFWTCAN